jgi:hypothetical protein
MSKHVDLIAVGALLVAFAFAARVHDMAYIGIGQTRIFRVHALNPIVIAPPHAPMPPRLPAFPRVSY